MHRVLSRASWDDVSYRMTSIRMYLTLCQSILSNHLSRARRLRHAEEREHSKPSQRQYDLPCTWQPVMELLPQKYVCSGPQPARASRPATLPASSGLAIVWQTFRIERIARRRALFLFAQTVPAKPVDFRHLHVRRGARLTNSTVALQSTSVQKIVVHLSGSSPGFTCTRPDLVLCPVRSLCMVLNSVKSVIYRLSFTLGISDGMLRTSVYDDGLRKFESLIQRFISWPLRPSTQVASENSLPC